MLAGVGGVELGRGVLNEEGGRVGDGTARGASNPPPSPSHITLTNRAKYANWPDVIDDGKFYGRAV